MTNRRSGRAAFTNLLCCSHEVWDWEAFVWHGGSLVHVVDVEPDLPSAVGLSSPEFEVALSGLDGIASGFWRERKDVPAVVVSGVVIDRDADNADFHFCTEFGEVLRHSPPHHNRGFLTIKTGDTEAEVGEAGREDRHEPINVAGVEGFAVFGNSGEDGGLIVHDGKG